MSNHEIYSTLLTLTIACSGDIGVIEEPDTIINDTGCVPVWYPDADGDGYGGIDAVSSAINPLAMCQR